MKEENLMELNGQSWIGTSEYIVKMQWMNRADQWSLCHRTRLWQSGSILSQNYHDYIFIVVTCFAFSLASRGSILVCRCAYIFFRRESLLSMGVFIMLVEMFLFKTGDSYRTRTDKIIINCKRLSNQQSKINAMVIT